MAGGPSQMGNGGGPANWQGGGGKGSHISSRGPSKMAGVSSRMVSKMVEGGDGGGWQPCGQQMQCNVAMIARPSASHPFSHVLVTPLSLWSAEC